MATSGQALAEDPCGVGGSTSTLTLTNASNLRGIVTHGVGAQLTIQGSQANYATWKFHDQATGSVTIEDANGNCLRVANGDQATVANGCDPSSFYQLWFPESFGFQVCEFQNFENSGFLETANQNDGDKVWVGPRTSGDFVKWTAA